MRVVFISTVRNTSVFPLISFKLPLSTFPAVCSLLSVSSDHLLCHNRPPPLGLIPNQVPWLILTLYFSYFTDIYHSRSFGGKAETCKNRKMEISRASDLEKVERRHRKLICVRGGGGRSGVRGCTVERC